MIVNVLFAFSAAIFLGFTCGKIIGAFRKSMMRNAAERLVEHTASMSMNDVQGTGAAGAGQNETAHILLESIKAYDIANDPAVKAKVLEAMHAIRKNSAKQRSID